MFCDFVIRRCNLSGIGYITSICCIRYHLFNSTLRFFLILYTHSSQPGQTSEADVRKRDLRAELVAAEAGARARKRKLAGQPMPEEADDEANKRRKFLQEAVALDRDDDDEAEEKDGTEEGGKEKRSGPEDRENEGSEAGDKNEDDDNEEEEEDEEDDTAELLRELEKIKRERAAEKAREEAEQSSQREAEIATANPLLNLAAALGQTPKGVNTTVPGTFAVKKRWDDGASSSPCLSFFLKKSLDGWRCVDLIFKNQAMNTDKPSGYFVNDLLRTEFHKFVVCGPNFFMFLSHHRVFRKFMAKFIKVRGGDCTKQPRSKTAIFFLVKQFAFRAYLRLEQKLVYVSHTSTFFARDLRSLSSL
jgi:protein CWC15